MRTGTHLRVLVASVAAGVVCAAVLGVLQYRSLAELEARTRTTFQDDLVRSAQAIAGNVEGDVRNAGGAALASLRSDDTDRDIGALAAHLQEILRARPEIDELFLFALDARTGTAAVFSTREGTDRCT